jgi:hypothetical protein
VKAGKKPQAEQPRMTMRVYTITRHGIITRQHVEVRVMPGEPVDHLSLGFRVSAVRMPPLRPCPDRLTGRSGPSQSTGLVW